MHPVTVVHINWNRVSICCRKWPSEHFFYIGGCTRPDWHSHLAVYLRLYFCSSFWLTGIRAISNFPFIAPVVTNLKLPNSPAMILQGTAATCTAGSWASNTGITCQVAAGSGPVSTGATTVTVQTFVGTFIGMFTYESDCTQLTVIFFSLSSDSPCCDRAGALERPNMSRNNY